MTWDKKTDTLYVKQGLHIGKGGIQIVKNNLEQLRKEKGINQMELAEILKVSRQTISSLENGRYNPSIILAFKIAEYFNKKIEDIFIYEGEEK